MATNKRKDSAALFELIDKSTLKVPKNAGSLKIPSWWSSKTNPATPHTEPASTLSATPTKSPALAVGAAASPSIRPPAKSTSSPTITPARSTTSVSSPPSAFPADGRRHRGLPAWVFTAAGAAILLLIVLIAWALMRTKNTPHDPSPESRTGTNVVRPINPPQTFDPPRNPVPPLPTPPTLANVTPQIDFSKPARVVPAADAKRPPNLYYLVIASAKTEALANENAVFIAQRGIEVSVERKANGFFSVISTEGFPKLADPRADEFRKRAIEISHDHPDYKRRHKGPYDDAYYAKVTRSPN